MSRPRVTGLDFVGECGNGGNRALVGKGINRAMGSH